MGREVSSAMGVLVATMARIVVHRPQHQLHSASGGGCPGRREVLAHFFGEHCDPLVALVAVELLLQGCLRA